MSKRTIQVKTYLSAEEFVAFHALIERLGLDQSSALRMWIREAIERHAARNVVQLVDPERSRNESV